MASELLANRDELVYILALEDTLQVECVMGASDFEFFLLSPCCSSPINAVGGRMVKTTEMGMHFRWSRDVDHPRCVKCEANFPGIESGAGKSVLVSAAWHEVSILASWFERLHGDPLLASVQASEMLDAAEKIYNDLGKVLANRQRMNWDHVS